MSDFILLTDSDDAAVAAAAGQLESARTQRGSPSSSVAPTTPPAGAP